MGRLFCGAGWGAVENTAKVTKGSTVAVFGAGVIGLAVIEVPLGPFSPFSDPIPPRPAVKTWRRIETLYSAEF